MLENIAVAAFFMLFELFILVQWLRKREQRTNHMHGCRLER